MKPKKESKAVYLPAELYNRIKERAETTSFGTVEEYVAFVLTEVLKLKEEDEGEQLPIDSEQEEEVKKRLRALGYLD